jgi:hypothetical protein
MKATGSPVAAEALRRIAELYAIEASIRGRSADARRATRHIKSMPLVAAMKTWLEAELNRVPPRGGLAERTSLSEAKAEIERFNLIIKKLQRNQFGRRAEQLDGDQLQLAPTRLGGPQR